MGLEEKGHSPEKCIKALALLHLAAIIKPNVNHIQISLEAKQVNSKFRSSKSEGLL